METSGHPETLEEVKSMLQHCHRKIFTLQRLNSTEVLKLHPQLVFMCALIAKTLVCQLKRKDQKEIEQPWNVVDIISFKCQGESMTSM